MQRPASQAHWPQSIKARVWDGVAGGKYRLINTLPLWQEFFPRLNERMLVGCDTESTGLSHIGHKIIGFSFSWGAADSYYIPVGHTTNEKQLSIDQIRSDLEEFFFHPKRVTTWHNYKHDGHFLQEENLTPRGIVHDTRLMQSLIDETSFAALKKLAVQEIHPEADKWEKMVDEWRGLYARKNKIPKNDVHYGLIPLDIMTPYAGSDAHYEFALYKKKLPQIVSDPYLLELYLVEIRLMWVLLGIEHKGVFIDKEYLTKAGPELDQEAEKLKQSIIRQLGKVNVGSNAQVIPAMEKIGVKFTKRTKGGDKFSLDHEVLEALASKYQVCEDLLEYRSATKLKTTYVDSIIEKLVDDQELHCTYNQNVITGRMCIAKGSLVQMPCDRSVFPAGVPIEQVREGDLVYTYDKKYQLVLRRVTWSGCTGVKRTVVVKWRGSGHKHCGELLLTSEHEVKLTNGRWVSAGDLQVGNRVLSLHAGVKNQDGYYYLYPRFGNDLRENVFVGRELGFTEDHIHHRDLNKINNEPKNLVGLPHSEHTRFHAQLLTTEQKRERGAYLHTFESKLAASKARPRGKQHHFWKEVHRSTLLRWAAVCKGQIRKIMDLSGMDFGVLKRKYKSAGIDLKYVRSRYGSDGKFISYYRLLEASKYPQPECYKRVSLGFYRYKNLCEAYEIVNNHEIVSIEIGPVVDVYDLEVEDTHAFIVNEICVHNSSKKPNLTNIPAKDKTIRRSFVPPKEIACVGTPGCGYLGRKFIVPVCCPKCGGKVISSDEFVMVFADYSQMEIRCTAHYSEDAVLLNVYNVTGEDVHTRTMCEVFGYDYDQSLAILADEKHPEYAELSFMRKVAKMTNFLIIYGGSARTLAVRISSPKRQYTEKECQKFIDQYFAKLKGVKKWINDTKMSLRQMHEVQNFFGRYRRFPELSYLLKNQWSGSSKWKIERCERQATNFLIQGCKDADSFVSTSKGMITLRELDGLKVKPLIHTHNGEAAAYQVLHTGVKELFSVETTCGTERVSKDHKFFIYCGQDLSMVSLKNLQVGDFIVGFSRVADGDCEVVPSGGTKDLAEVIGVLCGDGNYTDHRQFRVCFGNDLEWGEELRVLLRSAFERPDLHCPIHKSKGSIGDSWHIDVTDKPARQLLLQLGMTQLSGANKILPPWLLQAPIPFRVACVRGLFDSDGGLVGGRYPQFTNISWNLAESFLLLIQSLGFLARIVGYPRVGRAAAHWRVTIVGEQAQEFIDTIQPRVRGKRVLVANGPGKLPPELIKDVAATVMSSTAWQANQLRKDHFTRSEQSHLYRMRKVGSGSKVSCREYLERSLALAGSEEEIKHLSNLLDLCSYVWAQIRSCASVGEYETMDIELDGPDHSYIGQGLLEHNTCADLFKIAMVRVGDVIAGARSLLVMPIHDEMIFYIHRSEFDLLPVIKEEMERFEFRVPMTVDISISKTNWAEKKSLKASA